MSTNPSQNQEKSLMTYLPEDTRECLKDHVEQIDNFSLALNKFIHSVYDTSSSSEKFFWSRVHPQFISTLRPKNKGEKERVNNLKKQSSLKGLVRNTVVLSYFEADEAKAEQDEDFRFLFGSQEERGHVYFYDAFPIKMPTVEWDIFTPHYTDYYRDESLQPVDYDTVTPLHFLVVKDVDFQLIFGIHGQGEDHPFKQKAWKGKAPLDVIAEEVRFALEEMGMGAKTAVGYGHGKVQETE